MKDNNYTKGFLASSGIKLKKETSHESEKLNKLLNRKVMIKFFDGDVKIGFLEKETFPEGRYLLNGEQRITFYKSHVKQIQDISTIHTLKLQREYAQSKLKGIKPFEIRFNDRNYKVGDLIRYTILDDNVLNKIFEERLYRIEYITHYQQKVGYIVFTDKLIEVKENET